MATWHKPWVMRLAATGTYVAQHQNNPLVAQKIIRTTNIANQYSRADIGISIGEWRAIAGPHCLA